MRVSRFYLATLKEPPAEADIVSQKLMLRAGLIKRLGSGLYTWMPLGLRTLRKVEAIVREEMNRAGALELVMPVIQPAELWQESGRWEKMGPNMLRLKDRHERDFVVGPTHEEVITDIVRREIRSYRQLPVNFYQIQTKFRDEIRPRFGVMRSREFVMKDAYSFDADEAGMLRSYQNMFAAYQRIFTRMGLSFRAVDADTGAIGGSASHEFQVLADSGEDAIAYCPASGYAANVEKAEALPPAFTRPAAAEVMSKVATPGRSTCADVAELLNLPLARTVKCIMLMAGERMHMLLLRGDHMLNEIKVARLPGMNDWRWASDEEIILATGCQPGYLGPVGIPDTMPLICDRSAAVMADFICGANEPEFHLRGVNFERDCRAPDTVADIRNVVAGDPSPDGKGTLELMRGIEVGHVFALGSLYSRELDATYLTADGQSKALEMGCYGIGCTRIVAAAIEQNHDDRGIVWPLPLAPFTVAIAPVGYDRSKAVKELADGLHDELEATGVDVLLDDRAERPGVMFADLELIGIPHRITIGDRSLKEGAVEYQARSAGGATKVPVADIVAYVRERLAS
ncbi:MAG: proline--tRNA ligase [Betaproteobacteria bacterium]|nr:proline--tRNA ligase [Betaproteobacteria bacterium]MBA3775587.1 proline--tRNA ligase [Betaproteobacteria bacterium]